MSKAANGSFAKSLMLADLEPWNWEHFVFRRFQWGLSFFGSFRKNIKSFSPLSTSFRPYAPSDPVGRIHWRSFAKTDQLLIREDYESSEAKILVGIDLSPTMLWPLKGASKALIGMKIGFHLAISHLKQGDKVQIIVFFSPHQSPQIFDPKNSEEAIWLYDQWSSSLFLKEFFEHIRGTVYIPFQGGTLFYFISDGLDESILNECLSLGQTVKKAVFFQILSSFEVSPHWTMDKDFYMGSQEDVLPWKWIYRGKDLKKTEFLEKEIENWRKSLSEKLPPRFFPSIFLATDRTPLSLYENFLVEAILESWDVDV